MMAAGGGRTSSSLHVSGTTEASVLLSPVCSVFTLYTGHSVRTPAFLHSAAALHRHTEHNTASRVTEIPSVICSLSSVFSSHHGHGSESGIVECLHCSLPSAPGQAPPPTERCPAVETMLPAAAEDACPGPATCHVSRVSWPRHVSRVTCRLMRGLVLSRTI